MFVTMMVVVMMAVMRVAEVVAAECAGFITDAALQLHGGYGYSRDLPLERKFIMTPMTDGLRLAGTVEFAGLQAPPSMERAWQLHRLSKGLCRCQLMSLLAATAP